MKPADDRCEEHGMYLYRTGFGWSCKLGCYYCDDPQQIKEGYIQQYKEELKYKINQIENILKFKNSKEDIESAYNDGITNTIKKILELLED